MMKNALVTMALALLATFVGVKVFAPAGGAAAAQETAYERVMRTGVLRCGYMSWPPYTVVNPNTGEPEGAMRELVDDAGKRLGLKVEWVEQIGFGEVVTALNAGRFDATCTPVWINAERGKHISFLTPLFYNGVYAYVRQDDMRFDADISLANQPSVHISTQDGTSADVIARRDFPLAQRFSIPQSADITGIFLNVANKKADIVFNDASVGKEFIRNNPNTLKQVGVAPYLVLPAALTIAMGEPDLRDMLNAVFTEMQSQGVIDRVIRKYEQDRNVVLTPAKPYQQ
ncbi:MAG: transporter substrate-binding domain-containing protein [Alphaproteobacteria bacterium]